MRLLKVLGFKYSFSLKFAQVGDREDSNVYIRMKVKNANDIGMHAEHIKLPKAITQQQVRVEADDLLFW